MFKNFLNDVHLQIKLREKLLNLSLPSQINLP